jgi:hypothetical protein
LENVRTKEYRIRKRNRKSRKRLSTGRGEDNIVKNLE